MPLRVGAVSYERGTPFRVEVPLQECSTPARVQDMCIVVTPIEVEDVKGAEGVQLPTVELCTGPFGVPRGWGCVL